MSNLRLPVNFTGGYSVADLITHQGQSSTTLCACFYAVSPIDSTVVAMTSLDRDLTGLPGYSGVTFKSTTGVSASKSEDYSGAQSGQMEVDVFLIAAGITEADLTAGKWARAPYTLFVTNYEALNMGQLIMKSGYCGETRQIGVYAQLELKGLNNCLTAQIGTVTRPECPYDLGDARCGVDLTPYTHTGTLTSVTSQSVFIDTARTETGDYFDNGKISFSTGPNAGYTAQIDNWDAATKTFRLRQPMPYLPVAGNAYTAIRGDQKRYYEDCVLKFNNGNNNGSMPFMQTYEQFSALPQS
jgi:uncharacterized phage protein (TIGR02218 family)